MNGPTATDKQAQLKNALRKVERAKAALDAPGARDLYAEFMSRFALCEIGYKSLLKDYRKARGQSTKDEDLKIVRDEQRRVLRAYGIDADCATVVSVFDATSTIGRRNARGLRNSLAHAPNTEALDELARKQGDLFAAMDAFIDLIRTAKVP